MPLEDYPQLPAKVMFTGHDLAIMPPTLRFPNLLVDFKLTSPVKATYDQAILVTHLLSTWVFSS